MFARGLYIEGRESRVESREPGSRDSKVQKLGDGRRETGDGRRGRSDDRDVRGVGGEEGRLRGRGRGRRAAGERRRRRLGE